jgi:ATP-dependent Clp protease ATP-binding subunit ClpA
MIKNYDFSDVEFRLRAFAQGFLPRVTAPPIGAWLLTGPTGTGKTYAVEQLADRVGSRPIIIDCAEFSAAHEVARLLGAPPGYLGHGETKPRITNKTLMEARKNSTSPTVILFDEIEKAHRDFYQILLGVLDKGRLTLGNGELLNFADTAIFMTSNLRTKAGAAMGFGGENRSEVVQYFSPEFRGRLTGVVQFRRFTESEAKELVRDMCKFAHRRVIITAAARGVCPLSSVDLPEPFYAPQAQQKKWVRQVLSDEYGARPTKREIENWYLRWAMGRAEKGLDMAAGK